MLNIWDLHVKKERVRGEEETVLTCHVRQHPISKWGCWTGHTVQERAGNNSSPLYHAAMSMNTCTWSWTPSCNSHSAILRRSLWKWQGGWEVSSTEITANCPWWMIMEMNQKDTAKVRHKADIWHKLFQVAFNWAWVQHLESPASMYSRHCACVCVCVCVWVRACARACVRACTKCPHKDSKTLDHLHCEDQPVVPTREMD